MKSIKRKKVDRIEGYRLIDIQIFEDIITSLACPECCEKTLYVEEDLTKKKGLATYVSVLCECGSVISYITRCASPIHSTVSIKNDFIVLSVIQIMLIVMLT